MGELQQYCTFYLGPLFCGIEVEKVQEVIRYQPLTEAPLTPPEVAGLINLRGEIVTAIDLRRQLRQHNISTADPMNVVVRTAGEVVSFLVDAIDDVLELNTAEMETPPPTLQGAARDLIVGAYKLEEHLLLILHSEHAMEIKAVTEPRAAGDRRPAAELRHDGAKRS